MDAPGATKRFRLVRYFTVASLAAFGAVGAALLGLEVSESHFFERAQREQGTYFAEAQSDLVAAQRNSSRANLLMNHETGHVTLTRLVSNALWASHFAPLVAEAARLAPGECRALAGEAKAACVARIGRALRDSPRMKPADAAVNGMMRGTSVFKMKVYDLRGLTVYSSEAAQIGEDKSENAGWRTAAAGRPASELVHRDRFSSFEGEVENRDLIQSYVPVFAADGATVVGVFELYSDVTPLLRQVNAMTAGIGEVAAANQARVDRAFERKQREVDDAGITHFAIVMALLAALFATLLVVVRRAQKLLDEQAAARDRAAAREHAQHREKMAALAAMAAHASHEINNPLAVIQGVAEDLPRAAACGEPVAEGARQIVEQGTRIAEMTRRLEEFASAGSDTPEPFDVNPMIRTVGGFLGLDSRYWRTQIELRLAEDLPPCMGIPGQVHEVAMGLIQAHAEAALNAAPAGSRIVVESVAEGDDIAIRVRAEGLPEGADGTPPAADPRFDSARRLLAAMGGRLVARPRETTALLPRYVAAPA